LAGISILVAIRNGLVVVGRAPNRRRRPRRLLISIGGRFVAVAIRCPAAPDTAIAIAPREGPPPGSIGSVRIAVVTAIAPVTITPVTIAPLDILAFDIATLVDNA